MDSDIALGHPYAGGPSGPDQVAGHIAVGQCPLGINHHGGMAGVSPATIGHRVVADRHIMGRLGLPHILLRDIDAGELGKIAGHAVVFVRNIPTTDD